MVVLSSSISAKVSKMSCHECKGYKWQCPTTQSPTQQHNEHNEKFWVDQVTVPHPPWGTTKGGERQGGGVPEHKKVQLHLLHVFFGKGGFGHKKNN